MDGILIVGHGSRSKDAYDVFFNVVDGLRVKLKDKTVEGCFMEISKPFIPETIEGMYKKGIRRITILPYFLYTGMHIKSDIPGILDKVKSKFNELEIYMASPIGFDERLVDILVERAGGNLKCI